MSDTPWKNDYGYTRQMSPSEMRANNVASICSHEAAHCCVALAVGASVKVARIHQNLTEHSARAGEVVLTGVDTLPVESQIAILLSGRIGERLGGWAVSTWSSSTDREQAAALAARLPDPDEALRAAEARAEKIISSRWQVVCELAVALATRGEIDGADIENIIGTVPAGIRTRAAHDGLRYRFGHVL
jgi:hypothetical protein